MIEKITSCIQPIVTEFGALGVFLATLVEEIIAPIPSSLVPITAGFFLLPASEGFLIITWRVLLVIAFPVAFGVTLGSLAVYGIGYWGGKPVIEKSKKWLGLSWEDVKKTEKRIIRGRSDLITLFVLRILPIVPGVAISSLFGIFRYSLKTFVIITFFGALVRAAALGIVGWYVGSMYLTYLDIISKTERYILFILIALVLFFVGRFIFKNTSFGKKRI